MTIDELQLLYPDASHVVIGEKATGDTTRQRILVERFGENTLELNFVNGRVHGSHVHDESRRRNVAATLRESFIGNVAAIGFEITEYERTLTLVRR